MWVADLQFPFELGCRDFVMGSTWFGSSWKCTKDLSTRFKILSYYLWIITPTHNHSCIKWDAYSRLVPTGSGSCIFLRQQQKQPFISKSKCRRDLHQILKKDFLSNGWFFVPLSIISQAYHISKAIEVNVIRCHMSSVNMKMTLFTWIFQLQWS
jgi:hypothetical protein